MSIVRLCFTKGDKIRFLSHLELARTLERALRRSKLPIAYSEGFNPHMKVAYASALSVGVSSQAEYVDIELSEEISVSVIAQKLSAQLPNDMELRDLKILVGKNTSLMAIINRADYHVSVPLNHGASKETVIDGIDKFNQAQEVKHVRTSPKGRKEIDVKNLMAAPITVEFSNVAHLNMKIIITPGGSIKATEVLCSMAENFALPLRIEQAKIERLGLYVDDGKMCRTPLEF